MFSLSRWCRVQFAVLATGFVCPMERDARKFIGGLAYLALALLPLQGAVDTAEGKATKPWEHYQPIVDKNPFGRLGPAAATVMPDFAKNMRLCMLAKTPDRANPGRVLARAGFVGPTPTSQFTVQEGELTEDGFSVEEVNYAEQSVKLRKGTETAVFTVQGLPVATNGPGRVPMMVGGQPPLPPDAWKIYHEAHTLPTGEVIPPHVHMPGQGEGPNNRVYLTDDQTQLFRRMRVQNGLPPVTVR